MADLLTQRSHRLPTFLRLLLCALVLSALLFSASASIEAPQNADAASKRSYGDRMRSCKKHRTHRAKSACRSRVRRARARDRAHKGTRKPASKAPSASACGTTSSVSNGLGSFGSGSFPSACWRPYDSSSPFNTAIDSTPSILPKSVPAISRLLGGGAVSYFVAGDSEKDWGIPVYYSKTSDPVYTVHCVEPWGTCALEGKEINVPAGAKPSGEWPLQNPSDDWDSHLTVVDQGSGWEYDLWNIRSIRGSTITIKWGGQTRIDGDGLGSDAVAARYGSLGGTIRAEELKAGVIDHALALNVPCTVGFVYPATKGALECSEVGMPTGGALAVGQRLQLDMSAGEIAALNLPQWKEAILVALSKYGVYVSDTTGDATQWGFRWESPASYTSLGLANPFVTLAKSLGLTPEDYNANGQPEYWFDVAGGVDWSKLRVVS